MGVELIAAKRAVAMLESIGATYEIRLPDGTRFQRRRKNKPAQNDFAATGYTDQVKKLKVGDVHKFPLNGFQGDAIERFRGCIAAKASQTFGKEHCITHVDREAGHIEILRVK